MLYAIALIVVFLCLAALYESWSIPVAVLMVMPLGLSARSSFVTLRGMQNDVYLQVGLITTMGLSAKNAILMVEFAERAEHEGKRVIDAAIEAAAHPSAADPDDELRLHLRRYAACALDRRRGEQPAAIGTAVIGGMLTATALAIFYIPFFFVLVGRSVRDGTQGGSRAPPPSASEAKA